MARPAPIKRPFRTIGTRSIIEGRGIAKLDAIILGSNLIGANVDTSSSGVSVTIADSGSINTEFIVAHNIGFIPSGYYVTYHSKDGSVVNGTTAWNTSNIYLKTNEANSRIILWVYK